MKEMFLTRADFLYELAAPAYDDFQISLILNTAQRRVVRNLYDSPTSAFEYDEKTRKELDQLIKNGNFEEGGGSNTIDKDSADITGQHLNGTYFKLPADLMYTIEEYSVLNDGVSDLTDETGVIPVTHDYYRINIKNPYKLPDTENIWRMDISSAEADVSGDMSNVRKRIELIVPSGHTVSKYNIRYLKNVPDIVVDEIEVSNQVDCILNESLHDKIIDEAVLIAFAATQQESYQTGLSEHSRNK